MKKKLTSAIAAAVLVLMLCSCSAGVLDTVPADRINPITDAGFIEPDFVFEKTMRLLYEQLSQTEQLFYRHFYNTVFSHPEYIAVPGGLDDEKVQRVFISLKYDNPRLLCLKNSYKLMTFGDLVFIRPDYTCSAKTCTERAQALTEKVFDLVSATAQMTDDVSKEIYLHDALVAGCGYDASNPGSNAYDALISGKAACGGYAMGMKLLLDAAGIRSAAVSGNAGTDGKFSPHMWLCVNADGFWYHLDPTWNDPVGAEKEIPVHAWFNASDREMKATHRDYTLPKSVKCNSVSADYYRKTGLYCDGDNNAAVIEAALKRAFSEQTDFAELKFDSADEMKLAAKELFDDGGIRPYLTDAGFEANASAVYSEVSAMGVLYIYINR